MEEEEEGGLFDVLERKIWCLWGVWEDRLVGLSGNEG